MLPLIAVAVLVAGFAVRLNPLPVVVAAALTAAIAAGLSPIAGVAALGHAFNSDRYVAAAWLVLPVIGISERAGLQRRARALVGRLRTATAGRLLLAYLALRQVSAAIGLLALGGQAQMVRPLIAPMAEAVAERDGVLAEAERERVRANAAAVDNIGAFFGEDVFVAMGSVLLIRGALAGAGVQVAALPISLWAIPTALAALVIHGVRLRLLDGWLRRGSAGA
jgi:uncharacterized membrane protein